MDQPWYRVISRTVDRNLDMQSGSAQLVNGRLFYSPNSHRKIEVPQPITDPRIFMQNIFGNDDFNSTRQPQWWCSELAYLPFVPMKPEFAFEALQCLARLPSPILVNGQYAVSPVVQVSWRNLEKDILNTTEALALSHDFKGIRPPRPSALGLDKHFREIKNCRRVLSHTKEAFVLWTAVLSFVMSLSTSSEPHLQLPTWFRYLAKKSFPQAWLDCIRASFIGSFNDACPRAGVLLDLLAHTQPQCSIEWAYDLHVPIWYQWGDVEVQAALSNPRIARLAPPPHHLQRVAGFLTKTIPGATSNSNSSWTQGTSSTWGANTSWTHGTSSAWGTNSSWTQESSSSWGSSSSWIQGSSSAWGTDSSWTEESSPGWGPILPWTQESSPSWGESTSWAGNLSLPSLKQKGKAHRHHVDEASDVRPPTKRLRSEGPSPLDANTAATTFLPQATSADTPDQKPWIKFFARKEEEKRRYLAKETPQQRQTRENRIRQPGVKKVFQWIMNEDTGRYMRERVTALLLDEAWEEHGIYQRRYNPIDNEWDLCQEFGPMDANQIAKQISDSAEYLNISEEKFMASSNSKQVRALLAELIGYLNISEEEFMKSPDSMPVRALFSASTVLSPPGAALISPPGAALISPPGTAPISPPAAALPSAVAAVSLPTAAQAFLPDSVIASPREVSPPGEAAPSTASVSPPDGALVSPPGTGTPVPPPNVSPIPPPDMVSPPGMELVPPPEIEMLSPPGIGLVSPPEAALVAPRERDVALLSRASSVCCTPSSPETSVVADLRHRPSLPPGNVPGVLTAASSALPNLNFWEAEEGMGPWISTPSDGAQDTNDFELFRALHRIYGFLKPVDISKDSLHMPGQHLSKVLYAATGLEDAKIDLPIGLASSAEQFLAWLLEDCGKIPTNLWDMAPGNRLFSNFPQLSFCRRLNNYFVFDFSDQAGMPYLIAVENPALALLVGRLDSSFTGYDVASELLKIGAPFRTLLRIQALPSTPSPAKSDSLIPFRSCKYKYTVEDFNNYISRRDAFLQGPRGRAALLQGGLVWRLATDALGYSVCFDGPSEEATLSGRGFLLEVNVLMGASSEQYCDDDLSEDELNLICGMYKQETETKNQFSLMSWFPLQSTWAEKTAFTHWNARHESEYMRRLDEIQKGGQPKTATQWARNLKTLSHLRNLHAANIRVSSDVLSELIPD